MFGDTLCDSLKFISLADEPGFSLERHPSGRLWVIAICAMGRVGSTMGAI